MSENTIAQNAEKVKYSSDMLHRARVICDAQVDFIMLLEEQCTPEINLCSKGDHRSQVYKGIAIMAAACGEEIERDESRTDEYSVCFFMYRGVKFFELVDRRLTLDEWEAKQI